MAIIRIREGSCKVWHHRKPDEVLDDDDHDREEGVIIWFDNGMRYYFVNGVLQPNRESSSL